MTSFTLKEEIIQEYKLQFPENVNYHRNITFNTLQGMKKEQRKIFELAQVVPDSLLDKMCAHGSVDDIISKFESFISAGVSHFVLMFIGNEYYNQIKVFNEKVIPYFKNK